MYFGKWEAIASFERNQARGQNVDQPSGAALVAEIAPDTFLATGLDAGVEFNLSMPEANERWQFIDVEEGTYENDQWKVRRMLNGDESDFKLDFTEAQHLIHVKLGAY